jgi:SAM-dependent methyltransferase
VTTPTPVDVVGVDEERYTAFFAAQAASPTLAAIYERAYGTDHPVELQPFGFVTWTDLRRIRALLDLDGEGVLADIGCGRGGPGIWVARETGARLIGLDPVAGAVADAALRSVTLDLSTARFRIGGFTDTGLPTGSCAAVMSVDALWMVWDKAAALAETARVLAPGGRFVFTTWETADVDHVALLGRAGFDVRVREETPDWLDRQLAVYTGIRDAESTLRAEMGDEAAAVLLAEARDTPPRLPSTPRLLLSAVRR